MANKVYKRPDEEALLRAIEDSKRSITGVILRLAWYMGLYREEMCQLKWSDISIEERVLRLPDRDVPIDDENFLFLQKRYELCEKTWGATEYIMISDRGHKHMVPQAISRCARIALDKVGLTDINLISLRHDYVIRLLEKYDWPYVARVSGNSVATLYAGYSEYFVNRPKMEKEEEAAARPDKEKLKKIIEAEGDTAEGLVLWMIWKYRVSVRDVVGLTWEQVDMDKGVIVLADREIPVEADLMQHLAQMKEGRAPDSDPHVLLTPQSQKPYEFARISRTVRTVLIRNGMEATKLQDIANMAYMEQRDRTDEKVLRLAEEKGSITRRDIIALVGDTETQSYERVQRLVSEGKLDRIGTKYYPAGIVVPPERQYEEIHRYLEAFDFAYRQELAALLHIDSKQCTWILHNLVEEGKLVKEGQAYKLPQNR